MFAVLSRFTIANDMVGSVMQAFQSRPHFVDGHPGFVRMEVMSPAEAPAEIWLMTYWQDEQSYRVWHHSHSYHESHAGIPKGLKLVPKSTEIRCFNIFAQ